MSTRRQVRTIRWRCPGCGAMGDTTSKTTRRFTVVRKWCGDTCREADEVRSALREADRLRNRKPIMLTKGDIRRIRVLPPAPGPTTQSFHKHWIRSPLRPENAVSCTDPDCPTCRMGIKRKRVP